MARKRGSKRRRRGRFSFLYKLLAVLATCAAVVTALTLFFRVETIRVNGTVRYTEDDVRNASGVELGSNMYLLNKFEVQRQLREALPYIENVQIRRVLPDQLVITVTECSHVYAVTQDGVAWVFSSSGRIVDRMESHEARYLPQVDGCQLLAPSLGTKIQTAFDEERDSRQESLLDLLKAAEEAGEVGRISGYHLADPERLSMDYAGRFEVRMPYGADYSYMLTYLEMVMTQLGTNESGIIDLTVPGEAHVITD